MSPFIFAVPALLKLEDNWTQAILGDQQFPRADLYQQPKTFPSFLS